MGVLPKYFLPFLLFLMVMTGSYAVGQQGIFVPDKAKIFFSGDTAALFSDVINEGKFGVGKNAFIYFHGKKWENALQGLITDDDNNGESGLGAGGIIRFSNTLFRQQIDGGYNQVTRNGASFPILQIDNPFGVELINSTAQIRNSLQFLQGHLYLMGNLLVVGKGNPGSITGYNKDRFIVAGTTFNGSALIRENIRKASGMVTFPIGTSAGRYTPAAVRSGAAEGDDYYVSVADKVYTLLNSGQELRAQSINKTWQLGKLRRPGLDNVEVFLEHQISEEGAEFFEHRQNSYIAQYSGTGWDQAFPRGYPAAGMLSTSGPDRGLGHNSRTFNQRISTASYFTKFSTPADTTHQTKLWFNAERSNWTHARAYWRTNPEININYFIVQRRLGNDTTYQHRDTIYSKSNGGASFTDLFYELNDHNEYQGISYYRLKVVDHAGNVFYSNIVPVGFRPGGSGALIWPNPNHGRFFAGINGDTRIKSIAVYNIIGQKIHTEAVNGRNIIELSVKIPGTYTVAFIGISGNVVDARKVLVPVIY